MIQNTLVCFGSEVEGRSRYWYLEPETGTEILFWFNIQKTTYIPNISSA